MSQDGDFPPHLSMEAGRALPDGRRQVHIPWIGWRDVRPSPFFAGWSAPTRPSGAAEEGETG